MEKHRPMENNTKREVKNRFDKLINKSVVFAFVFLFVSVFSFLFNSSNNSVYATGTTSTSTITISTAGTVDVSVTPTTSGTVATSTAKSFTVSTNNYTGYTLRITTADNTGRLNKTTSCNSTDTTRCYIPSITTASSSITTNNTWGYKPSYFNSSANTSFRPSPNSTGDIINVTSSANAANTSDSYTLQVGTKVDFGIEPGTYSRTFTITAVGNPITYDLEYTDNTGTGGAVGSDVSGLPSSHQTGTINNGVASITLTPYPSAPATVPTRTGYTFSGWCSTQTTNNGTTCSGTTYTYSSTNQNYGTYDLNETSNNTNLKLYALWQTDSYDITIKTDTGISSVSLNGTSCTSTSGCTVTGLTYGQSYTLTATVATGYTFGTWSNSTSYGSIASATSTSTTFTVGAGATTLTPSANIKTNLSLKVSFGTGVTSVAVKSGSASGTTVGTVSTSGSSVTGLTYNTNYYLVPTYANNYILDNWSQDAGTVGSLSSTSNVYYW